MNEELWLNQLVCSIIGIAIGLSALVNPTIPALLIVALGLLLYKNHPFSRNSKSSEDLNRSPLQQENK